jgi:hypothetical protein
MTGITRPTIINIGTSARVFTMLMRMTAICERPTFTCSLMR